MLLARGQGAAAGLPPAAGCAGRMPSIGASSISGQPGIADGGYGAGLSAPINADPTALCAGGFKAVNREQDAMRQEAGQEEKAIQRSRCRLSVPIKWRQSRN